MNSSFQRQSGEADVSSSQSSSVDPHTPSVNGDLAPHTSDDAMLIKPDLCADTQDISLDLGNVSGDLSSLNIDPRSHWSRLMTRLNNSEDNSIQGTPQTVTPTPPTISKSTVPGPLLGSSPHHTGAMNGGSSLEHSGVDNIQKPLTIRSNSIARSSPVSSVPPLHLLPSPGIPKPTCAVPMDASPPDVLVKRTRQLQLLDSVLAEQSATSTYARPPMSAHVLGAYPHSAKGLLPGQVRVPVRPASVNWDVPRTLSTPFHHSEPTVSIPSLSGVLSARTRASFHQQSIPSQILPSELPTEGNAMSIIARPPASLPSQSPLTSYPSTNLPLHGGVAIDATHRGQMLSILSGERSAARYSNIGAGFRPGTAIHDTGEDRSVL